MFKIKLFTAVLIMVIFTIFADTTVKSQSDSNLSVNMLPAAVPGNAATLTANWIVPFDSLLSRVKQCVKVALDVCAIRPNDADSIAIACFDSLTSIGDAIYDFYNLNDTILASHRKDTVAAVFDSVLCKNGIAIGKSEKDKIFKGDAAFIEKTFQQYLSPSGKAFFQTRAKDRLQACIYDDEVYMLPWEKLANFLWIWDSFCTIHGKTYSGRVGELYLKRYLSAYLTQERSYFKRDIGNSFLNYYVDTQFALSLKQYSSTHSTKIASLLKVFLQLASDSTVARPGNGTDSLLKARNIPSLSEEFNGNFPSEILRIIHYYGNEGEVHSTCKNWLALRVNKNQWELTSEKPVFHLCKKPTTESDDCTCIDIPDTSRVAFLLLDCNLRPGTLEDVFGMKKTLVPECGSTNKVAFANRRYVFKNVLVQVGMAPFVDSLQKTFIMHNGNSKCLFPGGVLLAGDLDRDGWMDLITWSVSGYGYDHWLLLSGNTKSGELLRCVATRGTTGCNY